MSNYIVFYHFPCHDGELAKIIWELKYNNSDFYPWNHSEIKDNKNIAIDILEKELNPRNIVFLDICPRLEDLPLYHSYLILDHHENAITTMKNKMENSTVTLNIKMNYSFDKSGCMLTWEYCNPNTKYPLVVKHIGNKDIWNFTDVDTEPYTISYGKHLARFNKMEYTVDPRDAIIKRLLLSDKYRLHNTFITRGIDEINKMKIEASYYFNTRVETTLETTIELDNNTIYKVIDITCSKSNLFKYLIDFAIENYDSDVLRILHTISDNKKVYSMRSLKDHIRVDNIARMYGGNGHPKAAGYTILI